MARLDDENQLGRNPYRDGQTVLEESSVCKGFHVTRVKQKSRYTPLPNLRAMTSTHKVEGGLVSGTIYKPQTLQDRLFAEFSDLLNKASKKAKDQGLKI